MRVWTDLTPQEAFAEFGTNPDGMVGSDVKLPVNESGEPCPWPYDPQQLLFAPMGQYHCPFCGAMVMAGLPHVDYAEVPEA